MKYALILIAGVFLGLTFSRIPHYAQVYADKALPPPYTGPKHRRWIQGEEVFDE